MIEDIYIQSAIKQLQSYKEVAEKTFDQLNEKELLWQYNEESNSIAMIVNHMHGNMKSRWTDFLTSDGEKSWRKRDQEFEVAIVTKTELLQKWNAGWSILFNALDKINKENITSIIYIRNEKHSVVEAINRQMMHYGTHIGQIIYLGKMLKGEAWKSLSIPKGQSKAFNAEKFQGNQNND